jgi:hypothetical protein
MILLTAVRLIFNLFNNTESPEFVLQENSLAYMVVHSIFSGELGLKWMKMLMENITLNFPKDSMSDYNIYSDSNSEILDMVRGFMFNVFDNIELCPMYYFLKIFYLIFIANCFIYFALLQSI